MIWSRLKLGIHYDVRMYATFCFSILSFYLQFYRVTEEVIEFEQRAVGRRFTGPGNGCSRIDLKSLGPLLGASFKRPDALDVSEASKQRLIWKEKFLLQFARRTEVKKAAHSQDNHFLWHIW